MNAVVSLQDLLTKQQNLETELAGVERKISDACSSADQMVQDGHFDAHNIKKAYNKAEKRFDDLKVDECYSRGIDFLFYSAHSYPQRLIRADLCVKILIPI